MGIEATTKDYWIAPNAVSIILNALGDANRIQGNVASGAVVSCYIESIGPGGENGDGLRLDNGRNPKRWPLSFSPTFFNSDSEKYVYAAIPRSSELSTMAVVVFPSERLDIYGKNSEGLQRGSVDYFYVFLQGTISSPSGSPLERRWIKQIDFGTLGTYADLTDLSQSDWYRYDLTTQIVTLLKNIYMSDDSSFLNLRLNGKELNGVVDERTPVDNDTKILTPAYALSKIKKDTAAETITFAKGIEAGEWAEGVSGAALWQDQDGNWHFESDYVNIRKKLTAQEVAIQDVHHVGGQMLLTAASCKADFVVDKGGYYRVFFLRKDGDGNVVKNLWRVGDQAYCQTFNLTEETTDKFSNTFYWRLVTGVSSASSLDTGTYEVDGQSVNGSDYHYIDLSKDTAASGSDAPAAGDDIVQLGYRGTDDTGRQTAILIAGASADNSSPFIRLFEGINTFALPSDVEQLKPGDNRLKGVLRMMEGSTLEDGRDINHLGTSRGNLLKNTGFTGDFESVEVTEEGQTITDAMPIYSDRLKYWEATNVEVLADTDSASGYSAKLGVLSQTVDGGWKEGEWYMLSLRAAQGSLTIEAGGEAKAATLTDWERIDFPFQASTTDGVVRFSGTAKVCEIMLTAGNLPTEWHKASTDNDKSMAEFFGLDYLRKAITDATTNIIGGLVMTQILKVGNYRGGEMSQETGGMSGAYNDDKSPFLWGGGTMEDAIYTIMKYAKNPAYQPTEEEVSRMAKFVVTHGGRAILNDIVLRGYIYALGGSFRNITTPNKTFSIDENGTAVFTNMLVSGIAHFASAIMEGDYMYSQFGVMGESDAPSDDYGLFDLHAPDNINGWRPNFYVNFRTGKVRLFDADIIGTVRSKPIHITDSNSFGRYFSKTGNYYYYNYSSEFDLVPRRSMQLEYLPSDYDTIVCQAFPLELIGIQDVTTEGLTTTIINISGHSYKYYEIENWSNETFKLSTISDKTVAQFQLVWKYKGNGRYLPIPILLSLRDI